MADFSVDIPALKGASAALQDVRSRVARVECAPRLASLAAAMPGSSVANVAVTAADDVVYFQRKVATDIGSMGTALGDTVTSYTASDRRSAQRMPTLKPGTTTRLNGGPK